ncbi:phosphatase PAP2 family protein [Planctomycetota bacterium]
MSLTLTPTSFYVAQNTLAILSVFVLLRLAIPGARPVRLLGSGVHALFTTRAGRLGLFAILATGVLNYVQNLVDPWFTELSQGLHGVEDFAIYLYQLEGGFTSYLQAFAPLSLVGFFAYVYISVYPALYVSALLGLFQLGCYGLVRVGAAALVINYVLALPFFLFVSVRETWYSTAGTGLLKARLLLTDLSPDLEPIFRTERGIENNFPSLHTSVAVTAALLAWRSGNRRFSAVCGITAGLIAFSTLYLGFHWASDMVAGMVHALMCTALATRIVNPGGRDRR